jgi:hypothetical protein
LIHRDKQGYGCEVDRIARALGRELGKGRAVSQRLIGQLERSRRAGDEPNPALGIEAAEAAHAAALELNQRPDLARHAAPQWLSRGRPRVWAMR